MIALLLALWLLLALFVANLARNRIIGFWGAFVVCVITSPIVGLVAILFSPKIRKPQDKNTENATELDEISSQLKALDEQVATSVISRKEYLIKKQKLIQALMTKKH